MMYTFKGMPIHVCEKASPLDLYFIQQGGRCPFCGESMMEYASEDPIRKRHGSPLFYKLLEEMADTHDKKSHDYANNDNPYGNYYFAGQVAAMFSHSPEDAGFAGRLAEKIYRIAVLTASGAQPKNESLEDTERDIAVISALWAASRRERKRKERIIGSDEAVEFTVKGPGHSPIKVTDKEPQMNVMTEELLKDANEIYPAEPQPLPSASLISRLRRAATNHGCYANGEPCMCNDCSLFIEAANMFDKILSANRSSKTSRF